ncbi:hypothetical protein [Neolewinella agarilytica]|uniref:Uncharacterized protein n=1 Tax=Neolewinella agarilytica TaxID=478744 RepID=A0A1H9J6T4_9BACT|nr:hypothetical protein [Neolewinella agarilytica]SEQ82477.1 hypothetical protein SAMN05444359_116109 [Neolewinella agarilytica]
MADTENRADEGLIKDRFELLLGELQTIIYVFYGLLVGLGMLYNYFRYREFGINIFEYAGVLDFLIAPFSDLRILLMAASVSLFCYLMYRLDVWMSHKFPRFYNLLAFGQAKRKGYKSFRNISLIITLIWCIGVFALAYGKTSERGIRNSSPITLIYNDGSQDSGRMIGKTSEVYFLLKADDSVEVIPLSGDLRKVKLEN